MTKVQQAGAGYLGGANGRPLARNRGVTPPPTGLVSGAVATWVGTSGVGLSGADVTSWTDTVGALALSASGAPAVVAAPSGANSIGMDNTDYLQAATTGSLPTGASPRTVVFVGRVVPGGTQWGGFTYGANVNYQGFGVSISGQTNNVCAYFRGAVLEGASVNDGNWFIATATYDGSAAALYLGKTLQGTTTVALNTGNSRIRILKSDIDANPARNGTVGAVYVYPFAFSPAQVAQMVDYLTPIWLSGTVTNPSVLANVAFTATGQTTGDVSFDIDDYTGQGWYIVTTQSGTPTPAQIKAGLDSLGNLAAAAGTVSGLNDGTGITRGVAGLAASTLYRPFVYWENGQGAASAVTGGTTDTTDAPAPPPTGAIDTVIFAASALQSTLQAWAADWNGTVPSGKTASDARVIGIGAAIAQDINVSGLSFPQRVTIRTVGAFLSGFETSCPITGFVNMNGTTNLEWDRVAFHAPAGSLAGGWIYAHNTTNAKFKRCVWRGTPYTYTTGNRPITGRVFQFDGNTTNFTVENCVHRYIEATTFNWLSGTHLNFTIDGLLGEYHGGDDLGDISFNATVNGLTLRGYFGDRTRSKAIGKHADGLQSFQSPAAVTNVNVSYVVALKGDWLDTGETAGLGWQFLYMSSGASVAGTTTVDQCLFCNGQKRGTDKPNGNTMTLTNSTFLFGPYQYFSYGNAPFPRPFGYDNWIANGTGSATNCYQVIDALGRADVISTSGTGNIVRVTPGTTGAWDFSTVTPDVENLPTEFTTLWDVRPKTGGALDPNGTACGCHDLWSKLYAGDPIVCKSVVGWPVAEMFIKWFDPGNNFAGGASGYTGAYDSDGNNA